MVYTPYISIGNKYPVISLYLVHGLTPSRDRQPSSVSYFPVFFVITGLIMIKLKGPAETMMIRFREPIMFAAIPTHLSLFAFKVSVKSVITCLSASIAGSDFCYRKSRSLTICFTIFHHSSRRLSSNNRITLYCEFYLIAFNSDDTGFIVSVPCGSRTTYYLIAILLQSSRKLIYFFLASDSECKMNIS